MHWPTIPGQSPKASLWEGPHLLVFCAHRWEADPFLVACQAKLVEDQGWSPFPLWRATKNPDSDETLVEIVITGQGLSRAISACSGYLSQLLQQRSRSARSRASSSPVVVANFGTAGAYQGHWDPGQTLLLNRISGPGSRSVHYPERLLRTTFEEGEGRTVLTPQSQIDPNDVGEPRKPVFDMEAWGIAEVVALFLSWSHLVVGKFVLDQIPHSQAEPLDWRSLVEPHRQAYAEAAKAFLAHALAHSKALNSDPRQQAALRLQEWAEETLALIASKIHLSATRQRELTTTLKAWASGVQGEEARREKTQDIWEVLERTSLSQRHAHKAHLAKIHRLLAAAPVLPPVCGE